MEEEPKDQEIQLPTKLVNLNCVSNSTSKTQKKSTARVHKKTSNTEQDMESYNTIRVHTNI